MGRSRIDAGGYTAGQRIRIGGEAGKAEAISGRRVVWFAGADERALSCGDTGDPESATTR